jgi:hypothetical protein
MVELGVSQPLTVAWHDESMQHIANPSSNFIGLTRL